MAEPSWFSAATVPNRLIAPDSNGNWWIEQDHFAADFAADVPPAVSHFMAESQVPISTDAFTHKVTNPAWKSKPTGYMVATPDRSINPDQQRMMAKRAHCQDGRSEWCQPCGLHVSPEGNSQAHRGGCYSAPGNQ
jgi:hypothetical protein